MKSYYIPHKLKVEDITHLSDSDSELIISNRLHNIEDIIQIESLYEIFHAQITDISKSSIEVEILKRIGDRENESKSKITIIQSITEKRKFTYFLEKATELGVDRIIPLESKYSVIDKAKAVKEFQNWERVIKEASVQSRNIHPPILNKPISVSELKNIKLEEDKFCLSTEVTSTQQLKEYLKQVSPPSNFTIAIGPETGWDSNDLNILKNKSFSFVKLKGNILRTETAGLVITSILKYFNNNL